MKKQKIIVGIVLLSILLAACQVTPGMQSVINKNDGAFEDAIQITRATDEAIQAQVQLTEDFSSTDGSVKFHMNIDQSLASEKMPVLEVVPRAITSEDAQRVATVLLGDVDFYEREPSMNPRFSKFLD